jgi:hypothetical protein
MDGITLRESIVNLRSLLYSVINEPTVFKGRQDILNAFVTQPSMAEFSSNEFGLVGCSITTFKTLASTTVPEGFRGLNDLRIEAHSLLLSHQKNSRVKRGSRRNLEADIKKLTAGLDVRECELTALVIICGELRVLCEKLAVTELPNRAAYWKKESAVIDAKLLSIGKKSNA